MVFVQFLQHNYSCKATMNRFMKENLDVIFVNYHYHTLLLFWDYFEYLYLITLIYINIY